MSKRIKVKLLSCRSQEENKEIFVGKNIVGFSQTGGGICPSCRNYPDDKPQKYEFVDEMILILQDDEGNKTAVKINPVNFYYEDEKLFESKHKGKKLTSREKKSLADSLKYVNSYIPCDGEKEEYFPDPFLAMKSTSFTGDTVDPDLAFYDVDESGCYNSKDEIIDDDFIKQKKTAPTV